MSRAVRACLKGIMVGMILTMLSGCWDLRTANQYVIVSSMAVMKGDNTNYHVYLQTINSLEFASNKAKDNSPTIAFEAEGNTMEETLRRMEQESGRKLEMSHMMLLILDSKLLVDKADLLFFDYLESMKEIRDDIQLVAAHHVPASEFTKLFFPDNRASTVKIRYDIDTIEKEWGGSPNVHLKEFITAITMEGRHPVLSSLTIDNLSPDSHDMKSGKQTEQKTKVSVDGTAVMNRVKLLGFLDEEETRAYMWTQNKIKHTSLTLKCDGDKYMQVRITRSNSHVKVNYSNKRPVVQIYISVEGGISERQCTSIDLEKTSGYDRVQLLTEKQIKHNVESTVAKVQKNYGVDIFGFGEKMMRTHYRSFKKVKDRWDEEFVQADVHVNVQASITRSGMISRGYREDIPKSSTAE